MKLLQPSRRLWTGRPCLTRWRLIAIIWLVVAYFCFWSRTQRVLITHPSSILNLVHCHIQSTIRQSSGHPALINTLSDLCCPNTTRLPLRYTDIHLTPTFYHVYRATPNVCFGAWKPTQCRSHQNLAILIPYRDRELHLRLLLARLHPLLQHQQIAYRIYVIEQTDKTPFNRGLLLNVGIREALRRDPTVDCFVFHDVDLLPENSENLYVCDSNLRHLASGVDEFRYHVPFVNYAGGVSSLSRDNTLKTNGFPNRYWGWGNEDDELAARCYMNKLQLTRPPSFIGRYHAVRHLKASRGAGHYESFLAFRGFTNDGLTGMNETSYRILSDTSPERFLHRPLEPDRCDYTGLFDNLNLSLADWLAASTQSDKRIPAQWTSKWDQVARALLYTHILVDPQPMHAQTVKPLRETRETWYWFLHFYGWI